MHTFNPDTHLSSYKTNTFCDTLHSASLFQTRFVLKGFAKDGRDLTDKETKAFLKAADKDGDGKIGVDGKLQHQIPLVGVTQIDTKPHKYKNRNQNGPWGL